MKVTVLQRVARAAILIVIALMLFLFFSNDFGLVDIHKSSIVVAVGVDAEESGYFVTAQAAVPTPAQGEGSAAYTQVTGKGATVAEALDDINAKTGFYPKLTFCNLVILGESCKEKNLFTVLDYFYRNDYVPLTALVGMCEGSAKDLLGKKPADGGMSSSAIQRAMSEELKNSANCSTVNLKLIAQSRGSASACSYMPLISAQEGAEGGSATVNSFDAGGLLPAAAKGGGQGKSQGESAGTEFTCRRTVAFRGGKFAGTLSEEQAVALDFVQNVIKLAVINTPYEGSSYTVGLKSVSCRAFVSAKQQPVLKIKLRALANVQSTDAAPSAEGSADTHLVKDGVLRAAENVIKQRMTSLMNFCREKDCDLLYAKKLLCQQYYNKYLQYKDNLLNEIQLDCDIKIKSVR